MFKKIVIHNVGVLKAFEAGTSPPLSQLTMFYARNGRGKSTLTSVMRAARDGCSNTVMARRSLGNNAADPKITLISDSGNRLFKGGKWQHKRAPIEVFDSTFIADNVFAGEMIDLPQDRGLFSVIIGEEGVRLANLLERFNAYAKAAATKLKEAEAALADDLPSDISREAFFALAANPAYADRLDKAEKALKAVQQADKIAALKQLDIITAPELPANMTTVLSATVPDIDAAARDKLADHFRQFKLGKQGEAWVNYGVEHIHDDACPFCARPNVDELGMVTLYGQIFGEQYKAHMTTITDAATALDDALGEDARTAITATLAANVASANAWGQYVQLGVELLDCVDLGADLSEAHAAAKELLDRKRQSPLDAIEDAELTAKASAALSRAAATLTAYNTAVETINAATKTAQSASAITEDDAKRAVTNAKRRIARNEDPGVQRRIEEYLAASRRDERAKNARKATQKKLKDANEAAADHYHLRVNHYLERFGVSARITRPTNSMAGNAGSSDYSLVIRGESVPRGRGPGATPIPSFRNTLSTGDKTTLALAFFLAKLDRDGALDQKVVVFDDPLASHDSHRRGKTVEAIRDLCGRCLQLIVLSHDEYFLRDVEKLCVGITKASYQMEYSDGDEWSAAKHVRLTDLCRSDHTKRLDKLAAYVDHRQGDPDDIVLHVRQVIETHFRRSFTAYFPHNRNLGQMVRDIDDHVGPHPCDGVRDRMDTLNSATCDNHHGDDADVMPKKGIDPDELKVIVADALELIGARKPGTGSSALAPAASPAAASAAPI
ncbi:MAG: AAA family ATPase [Erythrobacter sp.]